jgi:hypothetical protein
MQLDNRVNVLHISIYAALIHLWYKGDMKNPVSISRRRVMELAKINAYATYHKCINELQSLGYIQYFPSYHPAIGSLVKLINGQ